MTNPKHSTEPQSTYDSSFPDATHAELPVVDQFDALEAYRAYDDGALAEVPFALAAYVSHQQQFAL